MLMDVFDRHPDAESLYEYNPKAFENLRLKPASDIERVIKRSAAQALAFKPICDSQHAARILGEFESSAGLWIYRRLEDVVNSSIEQFNDHRSYLQAILEDRIRADWRAENITPENLALIAEVYRRGSSDINCRALIWYLRNSLYFQQSLESHQRVRLVRYEDVVTKPASAVVEVLKFVGLRDCSSAYSHIHARSIAKRPAPAIDSDIAERCRALAARLDAEYDN